MEPPSSLPLADPGLPTPRTQVLVIPAQADFAVEEFLESQAPPVGMPDGGLCQIPKPLKGMGLQMGKAVLFGTAMASA
jgi:hypothetical protein